MGEDRRMRRARIVVVPIDFEGLVEAPVAAPIAHAEDWPQGTYSSVQEPSPRVRNMPREGYRQVTPAEVVARK